MLRLDINLVFTAINLIVLFLLMKHFLFGPVIAVMDKRKAMIAEQFANAENAEKSATQLKQQYEDTMKNANAHANDIVMTAKGNAKVEYERIINEADTEAGKRISNAEKTIEAQREKTLRDMESEIAGLAMIAATKVVKEKSGVASDQTLYKEFLEKAGDAHDTDIN